MFLYAVFRLLNIIIIILFTYQTFEKRDRIVNIFNELINNFIIFLIIYVIESINLNFQKDYHRVHIIEFITNLNTKIQNVRRARRLNNSNLIVYIY